MILPELIRNDFSPLSLETSPTDALQMMEEMHVEHLPVLEDQKYLGLVSESTLFDHEDEPSLKGIIHSFQPIAIARDNHLFEALRRFGEFPISLLPVVDEEQRYLGSLVPLDMAKTIGAMTGLSMPGSVLVLEIPEQQYSPAQIGQIIESNDAKLLALVADFNEVRRSFFVHVRINLTDAGSVISTFKRYNYTLLATYHQSRADDDLNQRFEQFMNFLNM